MEGSGWKGRVGRIGADRLSLDASACRLSLPPHSGPGPGGRVGLAGSGLIASAWTPQPGRLSLDASAWTPQPAASAWLSYLSGVPVLLDDAAPFWPSRSVRVGAAVLDCAPRCCRLGLCASVCRLSLPPQPGRLSLVALACRLGLCASVCRFSLVASAWSPRPGRLSLTPQPDASAWTPQPGRLSLVRLSLVALSLDASAWTPQPDRLSLPPQPGRSQPGRSPVLVASVCCRYPQPDTS